MGRPIGSKNKTVKNMVGRPHCTHRVCADAVYIHRTAHLLSQTEFAFKVGLSMRTIQRIENESDFLTTKRTAYKIADEIINNPPPENSETLILMDTWNKGKNA